MEGLIVALALTLPVIGLFVMLVYLRSIENSERLSMIEKGVDPSLFARKKRGSSGTLRISLLLIGIGFGFLGGQIWDSLSDNSFDHNPMPFFTMIFIFGGLGLLIAYLIEEKKDKEAQR